EFRAELAAASGVSPKSALAITGFFYVDGPNCRALRGQMQVAAEVAASLPSMVIRTLDIIGSGGRSPLHVGGTNSVLDAAITAEGDP
ncbi:hypothetical protein, partial [Enterococcus faecium]